MVIATVISLLLISVTIILHYEALRFSSIKLGFAPIATRLRILIVLAVAFASHLGQVTLYTLIYLALDATGDYGHIEGAEIMKFGDAFYFSITSYTTLGIGDLTPHGAMRIVSGFEALNGLVMVGWTASITYLTLERSWGHSSQNIDH